MPRLPSPSAEERHLLDPDGSFRLRLAADRAALKSFMAQDDIAAILLLVHRLAGAAATFGYARLGELAIALDDATAEGHEPGPAELENLVTALDEAIERSA